ncbi:unnamed protein product [Eretmochelys imbricata]
MPQRPQQWNHLLGNLAARYLQPSELHVVLIAVDSIIYRLISTTSKGLEKIVREPPRRL